MHYLPGGLIFYMGITFYMSEQVSTMLHFELLVSHQISYIWLFVCILFKY